MDKIKELLKHLNRHTENSEELEDFFGRVTIFLGFLILLYNFFSWFYRSK